MIEGRPTLKDSMDEAMSTMDPYTPLTETASTLCLLCLESIMTNMDGTVEGKDPEYLHDMRVASRRLRAALRVFGPCYSEHLPRLEERARFVTSLLGQVRDLDVRMAHIENIKPLLGPRGKRTADLLFFNTSMQWDQAREMMIDGIILLKQGDWYDWMKEALTHPSPPNGRIWAPAVSSLKTVLENQAHVLSRSHLARLEEAVSAQHALRIAVKRYRYSIELLGFCFKKKVKALLARCKTIQDELGLMHDYDVMTEFITGSRSRSLPKDIKKGLDEIGLTMQYLRHHQYETFIEHLGPFLEMDPRALRR